MFPIHINDGTTPIPDEPIVYIVAKEGIFLKKNMGIMDSIAPVTNISILESIQAAARMNIKKIPGGSFARVIAFFREVYKEYYGEAIVLLFYDEVKRIYKIIPPHQKVTAAACDYDKGITIEGMQMIGTIHSHASMSAFHSGTDDADEEHFDGLHITIGNVNQEDVSVTASIVANGHRFVVQPEDYVERLERTVDIDEVTQTPTRRVFRWQAGKMVEDTAASNKSTYSTRRMDKRFKVNVSDRYHKVVPQWMTMVEKGTYQYYGNYGVYGVWDGQAQGNRGLYAPNKRSWGRNFNGNLWRQNGYKAPASQSMLPVNVKTGEQVNPIQNVGVKVKPIEFPPHDIEIEDGNIPCQTCAFREYKFLLEQEDADEPDVFKCSKCKNIVVDDSESDVLPTCPVCNTNKHMEGVLEDELPNNYTSDDTSHLKTDPGEVADSSFIKCTSCGNGFHLFAGEVTCPFCYALIDGIAEEIEPISTEEQLIAQSSKDSGVYMSTEIEEANEAALKEARAADEALERIPDPNEGTTPLPPRRKRNPAMGFIEHFFGRKKGDKS